MREELRVRSAAVLDKVADLPLPVLLALGLLVRVAADLVVPAHTVNPYEFGVIAVNFNEGRGYSYFAATSGGVDIDDAHVGHPLASAFMPPLYTGMVTVVTVLSGSHEGAVWLVRLVNLGLALVTMAGIARLGERIDSPLIGRLALVVFALYPVFVYQVTQVSASNAYMAVEVSLLVLAAGLAQRFTVARLVGTGLLAGTLCLLRAEAPALIGMLALWLAFFAYPASRRARLGAATAFLAIAIVLPGAWLVRNSIVLGQATPTITTTAGFNFWVGNHSGSTGSQKDYGVPKPLLNEVTALPPDRDYELRRDAVFRAAALDSVTSDPLGTALRDAKKLFMVVVIDPYDSRSLNPVYLLSYAALWALGVPGAILWFRNGERAHRRAYTWLLGGYVAFSLAVSVVFFALARYRLPLEVTLVLGAAALLAHHVRSASSTWCRNGCRITRSRGSGQIAGPA